LRTGRTKVVGLLLNPDHEFLGFANELLAGITESFSGTGYNVTIIPDYIGSDRVESVRKVLQHKTADGVIFTRTECFDPRVRLLMEADFPFITHGRTEFTSPHPWVDFDNETFARKAVARLVERGAQKVSIILPEDRFTFAAHLRYGFLGGVREAGIDYEIPEHLYLDSSVEDIATHLRSRLAAHDAPDGVVCVGEVQAMAMLAALTDLGIPPEEGPHIVAKRASPIFDLIRPRIETVVEDVHTTGKRMGELLLQRMKGARPEDLTDLRSPIGAFTD
jgi:LacI family transcriptional regulator